MASGKTFEEFRAKHDPTFAVAQPTVFQRALRKGCGTFIVVAAQNGTPVEADWWEVIQSIAKHRKAEILVISSKLLRPADVVGNEGG
jgi:hypothetical protein